MTKIILFCTILVTIAVTATSAFGQVGLPTPGGLVTDLKTVPLRDSDTVHFPIDWHFAGLQPPWAGLGGWNMEFHVADASEVDVDAIGLPLVGPDGTTITSPFGARSEASNSSRFTVNLIHPLAGESGFNVSSSSTAPLVDLWLHVKGSDVGGNSDVDFEMDFWNIWHVRSATPGGATIDSQIVQLNASDKIWVNSTVGDVEQLHTADSQYGFRDTPPLDDPDAHWLHLDRPFTFHLTSGASSAFYATFVNSVTVGIEHVPEPASFVLLAGGVASVFFGLRCRKRRCMA